MELFRGSFTNHKMATCVTCGKRFPRRILNWVTMWFDLDPNRYCGVACNPNALKSAKG